MDAVFLLLGYVGYASLKFVGYTLAARVLKSLLRRPDAGVWRVGALRTGLGIVVGAAYTALWAKLASHGLFEGLPLSGGRGGAIVWYLVGLIPVRVLEWSWLIWFCFDRQLEHRGREAVGVGLGVLWSFVLDLPALIPAAWFVASIC